jgi:hypothetical protein
VAHDAAEAAENAILAALDDDERAVFRRLLTRAACSNADGDRPMDHAEILDSPRLT